MKTINLMLVDDQKIFIESLAHILKKAARSINVISYAFNGKEAVDAVEISIPDVIIMDIRMPVMNGVDAVKLIHQKYPQIKIIMLTTYDDDEYVKDALKYGAVGYLLKDIPIEDLVTQIKSACSGQVVPISRSVLEKLTHNIDLDSAYNPPEWIDSLNKTEKKILKLIIEGMDNKEITEIVFLADQTIRNYIHKIYEIIGVPNRSQAIKEGRKYIRFL